MKKSRGKTIMRILIGLSAVLVTAGTLIWARPTAMTNNLFNTGVVRIELRQDQQNGDSMLILPGTELSRNSTIYNRGSDCYVRVSVRFHGTERLDDSCLYGVGEDWVKANDGYYYYRKVLPAYGMIKFCEGLRIPEDFSELVQGCDIAWDIQADAIQSRNITPDIEAETPWGDIEISEMDVTDSETASISNTRSEQKFVVRYEGEVNDLIVNEENFFGNLPELMPGDEFTDGAKLINNSDHPIRLYFRNIVHDTTDVTDKIQLVIETEVENRSQVVYEGPLRGDGLAEEVLLMTIPAEGVGKMVFSLYVPSELDNTYALKNDAVQWIFSTDEILRQESGVDTGDRRRIGGYFLLAGLSLGFAVRMIQRKRSENGRLI